MDSHKLKIWIDRKHRSAAEIAREAEISESYLSEILSGQKIPSLKVASRLSRATGGAVPVDAFAGKAA